MRPTQTATPTTVVHFRTGPGTQYPTVAGLTDLQPGSVLAVLGVANGWAQLQDPNTALIGYSDTGYLDIETITSFFIPDVYWQDANGTPDWATLFLDPRYLGAILKATEGSASDGSGCAETDWFLSNWASLAAAGGASCGQSWFRGCYHFLDLDVPNGTSPEAWGAQQAEYFVSVIQRAGGLGESDLPPIVDVETAGASTPQPADVVQQIATAWAKSVAAALGRRPMLYRRSTDSDWPGLTSHMGCSFLWAKRYADDLGTLTNGWTSAALWQYTDGDCSDPMPACYPWDAPGLCAIDTSVFTYGDGSPAAVQQLIADSLAPAGACVA